MTNKEAKKVLKLTLKKKWFDLMCAGFKKIEFREPSNWIFSRLIDKNGDAKKYDLVEFKNGYGKNAPCFCCEFLGWDVEEEPTDYFFGSEKIISDVGTVKICLGKIL